ncbi:hypothetical protein [Sphingomonas xanthus]|uniref:hypothetical protein n=1 Tax=Sphingomonas xanthus TaxID=2594473 RepID=UPI00164D8779|nr:hypothetical protein [Sphingomonas xanthus]
MTPRRNPLSGGIFLFLGPVAGAVAGMVLGRPVLGMLYGFAAGIALMLLVWLIDRRRG